MATRRVTRGYYAAPYQRSYPLRARRRQRKPSVKVMGALGEMKFHDLDIDDAVVAVNGTIAQVSCVTIAEGNGENERIGRKLTIKKIMWRYDLNLPTTVTAANTSDSVRVILYQDRQANGATAAVTGILKSNDFQSFNLLANSKRFIILMDRTHHLNSGAGSGQGTTAALSYAEAREDFTFFKDCSIEIEYDSTATDGTIGTVRSNNIGVLLLGKSGLINFSSKMRLRYSDK